MPTPLHAELPIVRRASAFDAAPLAAFAADMFVEALGAQNDPDNLAAHVATAFGVAQQSGELTSAAWRTLVMEDESGFAAFTQVRRSTPPPCVTGRAAVEIHRFYVAPRWHGRGVAQRLMAVAVEAAVELGADTIWLGVWERNPRAIAFYAKCGFRDVGTTSFAVGPDVQTDRVLAHDVLSESARRP